MRSILFICVFGIFMALSINLSATNYYVSLSGDDNAEGTLSKPLKTIHKAIEKITAGDTIYVFEGTYSLTTTILINSSGTASDKCCLFAYQNKKVVLDYSTQPFGSSNRGITLTADYWHIKGIEIHGDGDNGMKIDGGNYNIIENCVFYKNRDSGLQMDGGSSNNSVINCDSYANADPTDYGDADGFATKMDVGINNYFYGCRAWLNCDDGWDGYMRGADNASTILENCWAFQNGYFEDGTDAGPNANGNGFKMGGSDDKTLKHDFTLKNCLAFKNKAKGFDQNSNMGSMYLYNCTGHNNKAANYKIYKPLASGKECIIKNCINLYPTIDDTIPVYAIEEHNTWLKNFSVSVNDFISIDDADAYGPRKADGSLPDINYMHLVETSSLINAGVDVGLPYYGTAPDLGCFEFGINKLPEPVSISNTNNSSVSVLFYPNPVLSYTNIILKTQMKGLCKIELFDITGKHLSTPVNTNLNGNIIEKTIDISAFKTGIYFYNVLINNSKITTGKLVIQ